MPDQWLTYQQAGALLGMTADAARQRARRLGWRTQRGNDGRTLILVPDEPGVQPHGQPHGRPSRQPPPHTDEHQGEIHALRELVSTLREQLAKAEAQADRER